MAASPTSKQLAFAEWLEKLVTDEDRVTLASLRRSLLYDDEQLYLVYGCIPCRFLRGLSPQEEKAYLLVAALFASHQGGYSPTELEDHRRNLGESLRRLAAIKSGQQAKGNDSEDDDIISEPLRRRMDMLLASTRQDLPGHLRQVVSLLKTEEIPIDWAMLLNDILSWESRSRRVQWQWSQAFYVGNYKKKDGAGDVS